MSNNVDEEDKKNKNSIEIDLNVFKDDEIVNKCDTNAYDTH